MGSTKSSTINGLPVGNVGLNETEHLLSRLGDLDEDTVVDLEEAEELEDFAGLGGNLVDTGGYVIDESLLRSERLTPGYGQRSRPWALRGRRSRQTHELPA